MSQKTKKRKKLKLKKDKRIYVVAGLFLAVLFMGYLFGASYYNKKFIMGTKINNIDVGGLTVEEANDKISKSVQDHKITLTFNDKKTEDIDSSNLGISFCADNSINKVLKKQNSFDWLGGLFGGSNNVVNDVIQIDDQALLNGISSLEHLKPENQVAPTDAYIQYVDGKFSIVKETYGSTVHVDNLFNGIKTALAGGKNKVNVEKVDGYVQPAIKEDDTDLNNKLDAANQYCLSVVSYTTKSGKVFTLDGGTTINWLTKNDDGTYSKDETTFKEKCKEFVTTLAKSYNTSGATRTFKGTDGAMHTVSGGTYGVRIKPQGETDALFELINNNKSEENRTPVTTGLEADGENGGLGKTYVEVNITKQHLWYYKDGTCIMESDFVSGLESDPERITPSGTYYVYFKQRDRVLRGTKKPDGTWPYETPVKYWMAFNGGIGFHDLNRSKYGGDVYKTNGSHGCINLPESFAASLYSSLSENTPVVVYR